MEWWEGLFASGPLNVLIITSSELHEIQVSCCPCKPVPILLLQHGLFAAAPLRPSLAVDLNMLEFL